MRDGYWPVKDASTLFSRMPGPAGLGSEQRMRTRLA